MEEMKMNNALAKVAKQNGWELLPDNDKYQHRIQIAGSSGNLYVVSQTKLNKIWQCSCLGFRRHRHCKHLDAMRPALEATVGLKEIA
jgi:hypothetical protein